MITLLPPEILILILDLTIRAEVEGNLQRGFKRAERGYAGCRFRLVSKAWAALLRNRALHRIYISGPTKAEQFLRWFNAFSLDAQPSIFELAIESVGSEGTPRHLAKYIGFESFCEIVRAVGHRITCLKIVFRTYEEIPETLIELFRTLKRVLACSFSSHSSDHLPKSSAVTTSLLKSISAFPRLHSLHLNNYLHSIEDVSIARHIFPEINHLQFDGQVDPKLILHLINSLRINLKSISIEGPFLSGKLKMFFEAVSETLEILELCNVRLTQDELRIHMSRLRVVKFRGYSQLISTLDSPFYASLSTLQIDTLPFDQVFDISSFQPTPCLRQLFLPISWSSPSKTRQIYFPQFLNACRTRGISISHAHDSYIYDISRLDRADQENCSRGSSGLVFPNALAFRFAGDRPSALCPLEY